MLNIIVNYICKLICKNSWIYGEVCDSVVLQTQSKK